MYGILPKQLMIWVARLGLSIVLLSLGLLGGAAKPASAGAVSVTAKPATSGIEFSATSPVNVTWDIWLSTASIAMSPYPPHFAKSGTLSPRVIHYASSNAQAIYSPASYNLLANTTYNYIVRGGSEYLTGSAKTLQRQRTVTISQIDVISDSDDFGSGELTFDFYVDGKNRSGSGQVSASSGTPIYPNAVIVDFPTSAGTTLKVVGIDDDCNFGAFCSNGIPSSGGGSNSDIEWATAETASISASSLPKAVTFETRGYALEFKVYATIDMRYF